MNSAAQAACTTEAKKFVDEAHAQGGNALVSKLATFGHKNDHMTFELLCAIQDEAKTREASFADSLFNI